MFGGNIIGRTCPACEIAVIIFQPSRAPIGNPDTRVRHPPLLQPPGPNCRHRTIRLCHYKNTLFLFHYWRLSVPDIHDVRLATVATYMYAAITVDALSERYTIILLRLKQYWVTVVVKYNMFTQVRVYVVCCIVFNVCQRCFGAFYRLLWLLLLYIRLTMVIYITINSGSKRDPFDFTVSGISFIIFRYHPFTDEQKLFLGYQKLYPINNQINIIYFLIVK